MFCKEFKLCTKKVAKTYLGVWQNTVARHCIASIKKTDLYQDIMGDLFWYSRRNQQIHKKIIFIFHTSLKQKQKVNYIKKQFKQVLNPWLVAEFINYIHIVHISTKYICNKYSIKKIADMQTQNVFFIDSKKYCLNCEEVEFETDRNISVLTKLIFYSWN